MTNIRASVRRFLSDESGATMVEYGLMVALIAIAGVATATTLGANISAKFTSVGTSIGS